MMPSDVEVFVVSGSGDQSLIRVLTENISVPLAEWVELWPNDIFFFARLVTSLEEIYAEPISEFERCPVCGQPDNCGDCNHKFN